MNKNLANTVAAISSLVVIGGVAVGWGFLINNTSPKTTTHNTDSTEVVLPMKPAKEVIYDDEPSKKMAEKANSVFRNLSDMEMKAVQDYTGPHNVTDYIRGKKFDCKQSGLFKGYIDLISNLIQKSRLEEDIFLYRGTDLECLNKTLSQNDIERILNVTCETGINDILNQLKGKIFSSNEFFVSTSTSADVAVGKINCKKGVFIKIHAKKGLSYLPIMQYSRWPGEKEVLLGRNLKLKITNAKFELNSRFFRVGRCLVLDCETVN